MKLTNEEIAALEAVRSPASIHNERALKVLRGLADRGLVEVGPSLAWQRLYPESCPLGIAVITADGRRALAQNCTVCDGSGFLPPVGGKPRDGGRRCKEACHV